MTNALTQGIVPQFPQIRTYVVNFDATETNLQSFNQYLMDSREIIAYWNYVPLSYMVKSRLTAIELQARLRPFFAGRYFIVAEVNPGNINGSLPPQAWEWFYRSEEPIGGLGGLFKP
jgi:hypothetical protein